MSFSKNEDQKDKTGGWHHGRGGCGERVEVNVVEILHTHV
jgi:hypothetical protein